MPDRLNIRLSKYGECLKFSKLFKATYLSTEGLKCLNASLWLSIRHAQPICVESGRLGIVDDCSKQSMWSRCISEEEGAGGWVDADGSLPLQPPPAKRSANILGGVRDGQVPWLIKKPTVCFRCGALTGLELQSLLCLPISGSSGLAGMGVAMVTTFLAVMPCNYGLQKAHWHRLSGD